MDTNQVTRYFSKLYKPGEMFELAFIHPSGEREPARRSYMYAEGISSELETIERAEAAGYNVYASVLPVETQRSGSYDRLWLDQDDPEAPYPFAADDSWEGAAWPQPTTLVRTSEDGLGGFRYQAIWLLRDPLPEGEAKDLIRRLAKRAGADGSVHDARRVLRVPGVMNAKRGTPARLMSTSEGAISPEAFELPTETFIGKLLDSDVSNPQHVLGEWLSGAESGDRARKAYVAARFLRSCGVTYNDAASILKVGAMRCSPVFEDRELEHALDSAFHRSS